MMNKKYFLGQIGILHICFSANAESYDIKHNVMTVQIIAKLALIYLRAN